MKSIIFIFIWVCYIRCVFCVCPQTVHQDIKGFGPGCKYRCNCMNNDQCDQVTGHCSRGCLPGWMGPACQYRNLASMVAGNMQSPNEFDSVYHSGKAVDFNDTTCSSTGPGTEPRWFRISMKIPIYLVGFVIKIPKDYPNQFRRLSIEIGNNTDSWTLCYRQDNTSDASSRLEINCIEPVVGQYIQISLPTDDTRNLSLCEVEIFGGRLVSFNKPSWMDTLYYDGIGYWNASYAVDGRVPLPKENQGIETQRTCASTAVNYSIFRDHWWRVDLENIYSIQSVDFYGRYEVENQFKGFFLNMSINGSSYQEMFEDKSEKENHSYYHPMSAYFKWPSNSRYVNVNKYHYILTVCELEVFADCPFGKCGLECNLTCMCHSQTTGTHKISGTCPYGCAGTWAGVDKTCNRVCKEGKYGDNCAKNCGNCLDNAACDAVDGTCPEGCGAGYTGEQCKSQCEKGKYGENCTLNCGYCWNNDTCNHVNGSCPDGCAAGYTGILCMDVCSVGKYGPDCNEQCGKCHNFTDCNSKTGECSTGCLPGWQGDRCADKCVEGFHGKNCSSKCGQCAKKSCDAETGLCSRGCLQGYVGNECVKKQNVDGGPPKTAFIEGAIGAGFSFIAVVVVVGLVIKRHSSTPLSKSDEMPMYEAPVVTEDDNASVHMNEELTSQPPYCNDQENKTTESHSVEVSQLRTLCRSSKKNPTAIFADFKSLPNGYVKDASEARRSEFISKNRYRDMLPYNENRVQLPKTPGKPVSTYINASYVNGYHQEKKYIASQGALETTVNDIWRMIWSESIAVIVMLTECYEAGKLKSICYWPQKGSTIYGEIKVCLITTEEYADFKIRTFRLEKKNAKQRILVQFQYTAWPDKDVPDTDLSIVQFWRKVRNFSSSDKKATEAPWLVHCSAGVGRTGTFIALDYLNEQGKSEGKVNIKECVFQLRKQRLKMVQTKEQYLLLHEALSETLDPIGTVCSNDDFIRAYPKLVSSQATNKQKLYEEFQEICKLTAEMFEYHEEGGIYFNASGKRVRDAERLENIRKSRDPDIVPEDRDRPLLSTEGTGCNDFINAVYIPTFRCKDRMILTQFPLKDTATDFLRLVWEYNITEIVLLENPAPKEGTYWPSPDDAEVIGPFQVKITLEHSQETHIIRKLRLTMKGTKKEKNIYQYHFQTWRKEQNIPDNTTSILQLISALEKDRNHENKHPVVVQCLNGARKSGVFCLIYSVLERMKLDREVAVAETLRLERVKRRQIIENYVS